MSATGNGSHLDGISLSSRDIISNEERLIFQWIFYSTVSESVNIFGTITNVINIVCFAKQGLKDSVNISLLGLAISDLGSLVTLIWTGICYNPAFNDLDLPFHPIEIQYLTAGGPHIIFARVTSCITVFITLERCLCVTIPLKVKTFLTSKRVKIIITSIFISVFGILLPGYAGSRLDLKFYPERNKTMIGTVFSQHREVVEGVTFALGGVFVELAAFISVVVCTFVLAVKLREKSKWRLMSTAVGQTDNISNRDQRVIKMIIVISTLFIVCFTPTCVVLVGLILVPELSVVGTYRNVFVSAFSICFTLESINSATNIIIYYQMSSRYRAVLLQMCGCKKWSIVIPRRLDASVSHRLNKIQSLMIKYKKT